MTMILFRGIIRSFNQSIQFATGEYIFNLKYASIRFVFLPILIENLLSIDDRSVPSIELNFMHDLTY